MEILVTGGASFIGEHFAETFVHAGHHVTVLDNFDPYYDTGIKEHNVVCVRTAAPNADGHYELIRGDVRSTELVNQLVASVDVVFHQGRPGRRPMRRRRSPQTRRNQHHRDAQRPRGSTTHRDPAGGMCEFALRLWQTRVPAVRCSPPNDSRQSVRGVETCRGPLHACLSRTLRCADCWLAIFYRVWLQEVPELGDLEFRLALSQQQTARHLWGRHSDPRLSATSTMSSL